MEIELNEDEKMKLRGILNGRRRETEKCLNLPNSAQFKESMRNELSLISKLLRALQ